MPLSPALLDREQDKFRESKNGSTLVAFSVAKGQSLAINIRDLEIAIPPTLSLTISGNVTSGSAADLSCSLVYYEDL